MRSTAARSRRALPPVASSQVVAGGGADTRQRHDRDETEHAESASAIAQPVEANEPEAAGPADHRAGECAEIGAARVRARSDQRGAGGRGEYGGHVGTGQTGRGPFVGGT